MKVRRTCRVCGKDYVACDTIHPRDGTFHWRKVACSEECGAKYLAAVLESRGLAPKKPIETPSTEAQEPAPASEEATPE